MSIDDVLTATREVAPPDNVALEQGRLAALSAADLDIRQRARIARRRSARRRFSIAAVAVAAGALALIVLPRDDKPTSAPVAKPPVEAPAATAPIVEANYKTASQIVNAAAKGAGQSSNVLGDAPYWKVESRYVQINADGVEPDSVGRRTIWQGIDDPGVLNDTFGQGLTVEGQTLALPRGDLYFDGRTWRWREINRDGLTTKQVIDLLTSGEDGIGDKPGRAPREWYYFKQAGELLAETPASPHVRQEIWKQLAKLTGVTTSGKATDEIGRSGWDLTMTVDGYGTRRFIVDPSSGAILQSESEMRGTTYRATYLKAGPSQTAPTPTSE